MKRDKLSAALALGSALVGLSACSNNDSSGPVEQTPQQACAALSGKTFGEATVSSAMLVATTGAVAEHCQVTGELHTNLKFAAGLPTTWNKKLLYTGGGGWDGEISTIQLSPSAMTSGYVTVASNGGHSDPSGAVFLKNPQAQKDFGYLQIHSVLDTVKLIVRQRYGAAAEHNYFEGCSNGGREALIQASRYPADFDGIVVRAPAYSFTELLLAFNNNEKRLATPAGAISVAKANTIARAVLASCDALDGVADGVVSNPAACTFDPGKLLCPAAESDACLTAEQLNTVKTIYGEFKLASGTSVYPGWGPGGEDLGWPAWLLGDSMTAALQLFFSDALIRYWFVEDASFKSLTFDPNAYLAKIAAVAQILDASADLKAFFARQGKMILVHGTADWAISYKASVNYWNKVATAVGGAATRDAAMEFYLEPGVQHCFGGAGPDTVDLVSAMDSWVTRAQRPATAGLVIKKYDTAGAVTTERPLCQYPKYPRYNGTGNQNVAASYTCTTP